MALMRLKLGSLNTPKYFEVKLAMAIPVIK
jgi:hypothetical protein